MVTRHGPIRRYHPRLGRLLALAPAVALASIGLAATAWAQDYVGSAPGDGGDEVGPPAGLDPGPEGPGDYVGVPVDPGEGGDYVGVQLVGPAPTLSPPVHELSRAAPDGDRGPVAPMALDREGAAVPSLPVSTSDVVVLGGLATAGLALVSRRARVPR